MQKLRVKVGCDVQYCTCGAYLMDDGCTNATCLKSRHMLKEPLVLGLQIKGVMHEMSRS